MDNNGWYDYDSCGSVSWQIREKDEDTWKPMGEKQEEVIIGRRLNIAYHADWK